MRRVYSRDFSLVYNQNNIFVVFGGSLDKVKVEGEFCVAKYVGEACIVSD